MRFTIERLANNLILLTDRACQWDVYFNADGTYRHGGAGSHSRSMPEMLAAVCAFINGGAK